jgi:F420-dependent oxidoreductase-like protein
VFLPFYAFQNAEAATSQLFNRVRDVALDCERLGYDSVWLDDHLMFHKAPVMECWTTLSALAAVTTRIRLGTMVTSAGFRNPALLAKMAATVDVVSGGRLEFGIGAGIQKEEALAYGLSFPEPRQRIERMREALEVIEKLWTEEKATCEGKHYRICDAVCEPKPLQKPHPPITIGGCGERLMLKVTAQHADRFDFGYLSSIELYKHKLRVLQNHCEAVGRSFLEIEKSCWPAGQIVLAMNQIELEKKVQRLKPKNVTREAFGKASFVGTPEQFVEQLQLYLELDVTHFMLFFGDLPDTGGLRVFAETVAGKI